MKKKHTVLVQGSISSEFIATSIANHSSKTDIGAHAIFLGQVRKDTKDGRFVSTIEYSAYKEMAEQVFFEIRESAFEKFEIVCLHIYHSMGIVKAGEISLFVFVSCKHRAQSFKALEYLVEEIKAKAPVWKKENYEDTSYTWVGSEK